MACFTDDLKIADDSVVDQSTSREQLAIHVVCVSENTPNSSENMLDVIL